MVDTVQFIGIAPKALTYFASDADTRSLGEAFPFIMRVARRGGVPADVRAKYDARYPRTVTELDRALGSYIRED